MLTKKEYELLSKYVPQCYTGPGIDIYIRHFRDLGYIRPVGYELPDGGVSTNPTKWAITPAGQSALQLFKEVAKQHANDESQRRFQNKVSVLNILVPFLTFILGVLVEYFSGVVAWIIG